MKLNKTPFVSTFGYEIVKADFFHKGLPFNGYYRARVGANKPYVRSIGRVLSGENKKEIYITDTNSMLAPGEYTTLSVEVFDNEECAGAPKAEFKTNHWERTRHWEFYFSQMMHTDIGYTDPQEELPELYSGFLDTVQEYLKKSDNGEYGETPYKYTVESSWMLADGYARARNARKMKAITDRIHSGDITVGAGRFNYTMECFSAEETARAAYYTNRYLVDKLGVRKSNTIQMFDNPAFSRSFVDIATSAGIKYGIHSMNPDRSPYHKKRLYDLYYMEGLTPGSRLLIFNEKTYGDNYGFGGTYWVPNGGNAPFAEKRLLELIRLLEKRTGRESFPYDKFPLPLIPYGDNKPPMEKQIQVVNDLNTLWRKHGYAYPRIKAAFPYEFFEDIEKEYGKMIPVESGTEENWWNDGWGTIAHESGTNKLAGALIPQTETLCALNTALFGKKYPYEALYEASQRNITYDEHTFGYSQYSGDEMYHGQFEWKRSNALGAMALAKKTNEEAMKALAENVGGAGKNAVVFNLSPDVRTDIVTVNAEKLPASFDLYDGDEKIPFVSENRKIKFIAKNVPAFGYKNFRIEEAKKPTAFEQVCRYGSDYIENEFYKVRFKADGSIGSIFDKENKRELVDSKASEGFNQYRYYDDFGVPFSNMGIPFTEDRWSVYTPESENTSLKSEISSIGVSMTVNTCTFRAGNIRQTVTLYNGIKRIDISNEVVKEPLPSLRSKEEAFFTFPFLSDNHEIQYGLPIGKAKEGEQVYGTSTDWYTVNNFISVSDKTDDYHMVLAVPNAILAQFGERRTGKWSFDYVSKKPYIYSYVFNNMWQTNFQGDQPGLTEFKYSITSGRGKDFGDNDIKFGDSRAVPMMCEISENGKAQTENSFIKINSDNVGISVLKTAESNGDGMIIRFVEKCGKAVNNVSVTLPDNIKMFCETDIIENDTEEFNGGNIIEFALTAYGVKTYRILTDKKLKAVRGVKAKSTAKGTLVTWQNMKDADYYEIFRAEPETPHSLWIGTTDKNYYLDIQVKSDDFEGYKYYVRGCSSGEKGIKSRGAFAEAGRLENFVPEKPMLSIIPRAKGRIDLSWTPDLIKAVHHFNVIRNGIWIGDTRDYYTCTFRDKDVKLGETYTYKITAVGINGDEISSDEVTITHNDSCFKTNSNPAVTEPKKHPFKKFHETSMKLQENISNSIKNIVIMKRDAGGN